MVKDRRIRLVNGGMLFNIHLTQAKRIYIMRNSLITAVHAALTTEESASSVGVNLEEVAIEAEAPEEYTEEERQARKARLDRAREQAAKIAGDGTAVPDNVMGLAQKEIQACWAEFSGKGGVWDLTKQVKGKMRNISAHILNIAKACAVAAYERGADQPDFDYVKLAGAMFRNSMAAAESSLRGTLDLTDDEAEAKLDAFLSKSWAVYKSQAKSGFDQGIDPRDFDSLYAVTKAVAAAKQAKNPGTRDGGTQATENQPQASGQGEEPQATDADDDTETDGQDIREVAEIVSKGSAKVQAALVLFHRAIDDTNLDDAETETKVCNIISLAVRELNKLPRLSHEAEEEEEVTELEDMTPNVKEA